MKILHVILSSGFAGSERSTAESCNSQLAAGHQLGLVVRRGHRGATGASVVDHVDKAVRRFEVPNLFFSRRALARAIREFKPDVIHCHLRRSVRLVAKCRPQAASVATLHISWNGPHFANMDGVICNARWQLADVPASYQGGVFKANNSLRPHPHPDAERVAALRSEMGLPAQALVIGGVGRLSERKGWDLLIRAFRAARLPDNARLLIVGEGRHRKELERLADGDPRIAMPGFRSDIKDLYSVMDVFVCPSRFEPLPRTILEAMDAATPVIASTAGGCRELIEDYGGELFEIDDLDALTALLNKVATHAPPRHQPDLSAHHVDRCAAATLDFYGRLVSKRLMSGA